MNHIKPPGKERLLLSALVLLAFAGAFIRLFFGVDLSDETLYVSEAYITLQGAVPVVNNWMQFAPFTLLNAPILRLVQLAAGGNAGVMLGMRMAYLLCKILLAAAACLLLKKKFPLWMLAVSGAVCMVPVYCNISNLSYTSHSFYLLFLSGAVMAAAMLEAPSSKRAFPLAFLSGICSAFSAGVYPTHIATCTLLALALLIGELRLRRSCHLFAGYAAGGLTTAATVVAYLAVKGGGISSILFGIHQILSGGYLSLWTRTPLMELVWSTLIVGACLSFWLLLLAVLLAAGPIRKHFREGHRGLAGLRGLDWPRMLFTCGWLAYLLNLLIGAVLYLFFPGRPFVSYHRTFLIQIIVPPCLLAPAALWLVRRKHPACKTLFAALWFPAGLWLVVTGLSVFDGYANRCIALLGGQFCFLVFSALYITDTCPPRRASRLRLGGTAACLCAAVLSLYGFVYGDAPLSDLTCRVEEGVYQGLYTTRDKAQGLPALENELQTQLSPEDTVLFLDCAPMAYLMTPARHCTATTWDTGYGGSAEVESRLPAYFSVTGQIPGKIVYVDAGRYETLSIDEDAYSFNEFVNTYYTLTFRNDDAAYPLRVYTRNGTPWQP